MFLLKAKHLTVIGTLHTLNSQKFVERLNEGKGLIITDFLYHIKYLVYAVLGMDTIGLVFLAALYLGFPHLHG